MDNDYAKKNRSFNKSDVEKMPAHWLMAGLGKKVLRPGGIELTGWLLENSGIKPADDVIELAPGLGVTSKKILALNPKSYTAIEKDENAFQYTRNLLSNKDLKNRKVLWGDAADISIPDASASIIFGEAILSMQTPAHKKAIFAEARRLLRPGGCYAIHELAISPDDIRPDLKKKIQKDISREIRVGVNIGTVDDWKIWLEDSGFDIEKVRTAQMKLLDPDRMIRDEGLTGLVRILINALKAPGALRRLRKIRLVFQTYAKNLRGVAIIAKLK